MANIEVNKLFQTLYDRILILESTTQVLTDVIVPLLMTRDGKTEAEVCAALTELARRDLIDRQASDPLVKSNWNDILSSLGLEGPDDE